MDINDFQGEVIKVFSEMSSMPNQTKHTKQSALIHLVEEVGEVARQLTNEYHRPEKFNKENLGNELGDIMMFVVLLASYYDFDLSEKMKTSILKVEEKIKEFKK